MEKITDDSIIELYFARNEKAICETDAKYGAMLFRIAYNILSDKADSEECRNDTYLCVWNAIPPARPRALPAFLSKIVRDTAMDKYREKARKKRIPSELTVSMDELEEVLCGKDSTEAACTAKELGALISEYLLKLPERQRYVFIGRFYMSETIESLSEKLGVGVATVHRDIEKIKRGLKAYLTEKGVYL